MSLPKFLTGALALLPLSVISAQGALHDAGSPPAVVWVSALGAVSASAAFFNAFSHSKHHAGPNDTPSGLVKAPQTSPDQPPAAPPGTPGVSGNTGSPGATVPADDPPTIDSPPTPETVFVPQVDSETPPGNHETPANVDVPDDQPVTVIETPNVATVPEPGTLGLIATGVVGLVPLARRRTRR